jgi:hypothetical protein
MFIKAVATLLAVAASSVSASPITPRQVATPADCNISTYQLTASNFPSFTPPYADVMYTQLYFANNSAFIGQVRYQSESEPLIISAESGFTSQHQAPTGFTSAYLTPGKTSALQWTIPHSGLIPEGASPVGFNFTGDLWGVNGTTDKWAACPVAFSADGNWTIAQIYYEGGAANKSCLPITLTKYVYGHPGDDENF